MGYQVYRKTAINWQKKKRINLVLKYVLILAFIFRNVTLKPTTLQETLKACSSRLYRNVHTIPRLLLITPVTSATVKRNNSSLRFVKNVYSSTLGEERLNVLLLLFIHKDIPLNYNAVVDEYAKRDQRRMTFTNPLQWFISINTGCINAMQSPC